MTDAPMTDRLQLVEAMVFELLRRSIPDEAIPFTAARIAAAAPAYSKADVVNRLGAETTT